MTEELPSFHCSFLIDYIVFGISPENPVLVFLPLFSPRKKNLFTFCGDLKWLPQAYAANAEMRWRQTGSTPLYVSVPEDKWSGRVC